MPTDYQDNLANCIIALNMAQRMNADPLMVMQNLHIIYGRTSWSSKYLISALNQSGMFSPIEYTFVGEQGKDSWGCYASAEDKRTGKTRVGTTIDIAMAKAEGWYQKNGSKWKTMPQQMLIYRAASFFVNAYAPDITMGFPTSDEIYDTYDAEQSEGGSYVVDVKRSSASPTTEDINAVIEAQADDTTPTDTKWPQEIQLEDGSGGTAFVDSNGTLFDPRQHVIDVATDGPAVDNQGQFVQLEPAQASMYEKDEVPFE